MIAHRAASVTAAALLLASSAAAQSGGCDRPCLENFLDEYVDAVVAHDAARLPLAAGVKFTENGVELALDDGLWHTASGKGDYALKLADVERGQAVLMGTIREAGEPTVLVARLGVVERTIAEIETLVIRNADVAKRLDEIGAPRRAWSEPVPPGDRLPRAELVRIANQYFSGIQRNDGKGDYPLSADCARLENGLVLAGDPALVSPRALGRPNGPQVGCLEQFRSGIFYYVTRIRDRRFVLVDPERGVVFAFAFFDNAGGDSRFGTLPDGRRVESGPKQPFTWQIAEAFKIERGLIGPVESVLQQAPYGMGSGWSSREEALSTELPPLAQLGWLAELAGSCWKSAFDRQCYQTQHGSLLRGTIAIGSAVNGDSAIGWDFRRGLVMLSWADAAPPTETLLHFENGALAFETPGATTRTLWRRQSADAFVVTPQRRSGAAWANASPVEYRRDGEAPLPFLAASAPAAESIDASAFGWLARLAGRCWRADRPQGDGFERHCYAWQYPSTLRASLETHAGARSRREDRAFFQAEGGLKFFYWDSSGDLGAGTAQLDGERLVLDARASRAVATLTSTGFRIATAEPPDGAARNPPLDFRAERSP